MKVYIVTDGDYSDFHIISVWSDKPTAEKVAGFHGGAEVREYEVNGPMESERMTFFFMFNEKGDIEKGWVSGFACEVHQEERCEPFHWLGGNKELLKVFAKGKDRDHAFKKACDMRAKYLAEQAGI